MNYRTLASYHFAHIEAFYVMRSIKIDMQRLIDGDTTYWSNDHEMATQYRDQSKPLSVPASWFRR